MDHFSLLPLELKEYIFTFLPGEDLWTCLGVCSEWRRLVNFNKQWKHICCSEHIDLYDPDEEEDEPQSLCRYAILWRKNAQTFQTWRRNAFKDHIVPITNSKELTCRRIFTYNNKMALITSKDICEVESDDNIEIHSFGKGTCIIDEIELAISPHAVTINNCFVVMSSGNIVLVYKRDPDYKLHFGAAFCDDSKMHFIPEEKIREKSEFKSKTDPYVRIEVLSIDYLWLSCINSETQLLYVVNLKTLSLLPINIVSRLMCATKSHVVVSTILDVQVYSFKGDLLLKLNVQGRCKATDDFVVTSPRHGQPITVWGMNGSRLYELPGPILFDLDPTRNLLYECTQNEGESCTLTAVALRTGDCVWKSEMQKSRLLDIDDMYQVCDKFLIIDIYKQQNAPNFHYAYIYDLDNKLLLYKTALDGYTMKISKNLWVLRTEDDLILQIY